MLVTLDTNLPDNVDAVELRIRSDMLLLLSNVCRHDPNMQQQFGQWGKDLTSEAGCSDLLQESK